MQCAIAVIAALLLIPVPAAAAAPARPDDRVAIDACLRAAQDNPARCIGTVYTPCSETPTGSTTAGMGECAGRETQVWSDMMEENFRALLAGPLGQTQAQPWNRPAENRRDRPVPGTDILNDMQQTWLVWRAKKCDTLAMQAEGGTLSRVLYGICAYEETGRQALWLKSLVDDAKAR